ncbi:hypothetical protein PAF15_02640 [Weissella koreensis]|uniref:hypothetical protein n=1 Tax=Weissella koreensis TaxID=165096 RepID=UPI0022BA2E70|nr:hypothetical protein [Weissella koreensis]MCZ9310871.1 hypothetical protein [Weissella koreensis]
MMEENKELQQYPGRIDLISFVFFYLIILIQTILFTSFNTFFPHMSILMAKLVNILIILYFIYSILIKITRRKIIFTLIVLLIILSTVWYSGVFSPYIKLLILSVAVPATIPSARNISKIFGIAMVTTMIITIWLSINGALPQSGTASRSMISNYQETVYFMGFNHPNAFGTFLSMIMMIFTFLFYKKYKWRVIIGLLLFAVIDIYIGAGTASFSILILMIILFLPIKLKKIYKIFYLLPTIVTLFSLWLSCNNTSNLGNFINTKVASRPNVWNAYITQYPIGFINKPPMVDVGGYSGILGNGVLDGSYIYILIFWGILSWIIYNFIFISLLKFSIDINNKALFGIAIAIIINAFPESHMIMFYENVFLLFVGFYQYSIIERRKILEL